MENVPKERLFIRIQEDVKMWRRMKQQKSQKKEYICRVLGSLLFAFKLPSTSIHRYGIECCIFVHVIARTDSHLMDVIPIETSMGIAVSGSSQSARIKNTFHWNVSQSFSLPLRLLLLLLRLHFRFLFVLPFLFIMSHSLDLQRLKRRTQSNAIYNDEMNQKICALFASHSIDAGQGQNEK